MADGFRGMPVGPRWWRWICNIRCPKCHTPVQPEQGAWSGAAPGDAAAGPCGDSGRYSFLRRAIPHFGHLPGALAATSGCIGQPYAAASSEPPPRVDRSFPQRGIRAPM